MLRRHPAVLALCVFGLGFALVWAGFSPIAQDPYLFCPGVPQAELTSVRVEPALWPPGTTRCDYGSSSRIYVPWEEWLSLALLAAGVGVAASAPSRPLRVGIAVSLILAAGAALFGALWWAPLLVPLAGATAILLVFERRDGL